MLIVDALKLTDVILHVFYWLLCCSRLSCTPLQRICGWRPAAARIWVWLHQGLDTRACTQKYVIC